jgi:hypothetical protein
VREGTQSRWCVWIFLGFGILGKRAGTGRTFDIFLQVREGVYAALRRHRVAGARTRVNGCPERRCAVEWIPLCARHL